MLHYHGTPITNRESFYKMAGRNFCVSYATPTDIRRAHEIGQSVMLDNGAFTFWRKGIATDDAWWDDYAEWVEPWLDHPTTWCVIPDVIGGTEEQNDRLIFSWRRRMFKRSAPVWHMHEPLERLQYLANAWDRICIGSSGTYADPRSNAWKYRMDEAWNFLLPDGGGTPYYVHMLRAMEQACTGDWPFASADSTNAAQNHHRHESPVHIAQKWDAMQAPARWVPREQMELAA